MLTYTDLFMKLAGGMVYHPSNLGIKEQRTGKKVVLTVKMHPDDIGILMGKRAKTVRAFGYLFWEIGRQRGDLVYISLVQPEGKKLGTVRYDDSEWSKEKTDVAGELVLLLLKEAGVPGSIVEEKDHRDTTMFVIATEAKGGLVDALSRLMETWGAGNGRRIVLIQQ